MLSCDTRKEEPNRALKRSKVDSPVISQVTYEGTEASNEERRRRHRQRPDGCYSLSPPASTQEKKEVSAADDDDDNDDHNSISTEDVTPEATVLASQRHSGVMEEVDMAREVPPHDAPRVALQVPSGAASTRTPMRLSAPGATTTATTTSTAIATVPLPVSTKGAITTLRSLSQLAMLVSGSNTSSAMEKKHPDLRLKAGESVMLLLHFDESSLRVLINSVTSELSQMRVFTLNLAKLPPQDYEPTTGKRPSTGSSLFHATSTATAAHTGAISRLDILSNDTTEEEVGRLGDVAAVTGGTQDTLGGGSAVEEDDDEEEEEELVPAVHPMAVSTAAAERERTPRLSSGSGGGAVAATAGSGGALPFDETVSVSSLSGDLQHASEVISEKLRQLLSVDTILNPHASQSHSASNSGNFDGVGAGSKREPLLFPAMIVWRAAGAPREEYPPAPPQTYSSQPSATPAELFCDRMSTQGGPLVVKEATSIDQVHSLTLFRPVYTMENLFRTLVRTVAPSFASRAPGDKSRTVLYLGASWCPPCMRFVRDMPQFIREDLPTSVVCTVKADMDLAKPIYDYFKVEIIPTFVVLDNEVLMKCYESLQQRGMAESAGSVGTASQSEYLLGIQNAFTKAELARLQNSNRQLVSTFVSKHSQTLSFDEDF